MKKPNNDNNNGRNTERTYERNFIDVGSSSRNGRNTERNFIDVGNSSRNGRNTERTSEINFIDVGNSLRNGRNNSRRVNIVGSRESGRRCGLPAVQSFFELFVDVYDLVTSEDGIKYLYSSNDVTVKKCESIPAKCEWYKSFKVSVLLDDRDKH